MEARSEELLSAPPAFRREVRWGRQLRRVFRSTVVMLGGAWVPTFVFPKWLQNVTVIVPVTTLCPCSKAISVHGAHNQRGQVTVGGP